MTTALGDQARRSQEAGAEHVEAAAVVAAVLGSLALPVAVLSPVRDGAKIVDFRLIIANQAFSALFGAAGAKPLTADPELGDVFAAAVAGASVQVERLVRVGDRQLLLAVAATPAGDAVLATVTDQSRLAQQERALQQARDAADAAAMARMEFLATVSHELRTPLNTIIGFAEIMKEGLFGQFAHPKYNEYIQDIFKAGKHLLGILDDFLDHNRLQGVIDQSARGYRALIDIAPDMICLTRGGRVVMLNAAGADMLAVWPAARVVGQPFEQFVHPDYRELAEDDMTSLIGERHRVPMKFIRADKREIDVEVAVMRHRDEESGEDAVMVVARDITDRSRAIRAVLAREERLRKIMATVAEGIISIDEEGRVESVNPAAERIFGYAGHEIVGGSVSALVPDFHEAQDVTTPRALGVTRETQGRRKDGSAFPIELTVNDLKLAGNRLFIAVAHDITERKQAESHLRFLAGHDPLTGLPNRALFQERLSQAISRADAESNKVAVLFIDLDDFKRVNDALGHRAGDLVLQAAAKRLEGCVRPGDTVARLSGDEFTIILSDIASEGHVVDHAQQILDHLFQPFQVEGKEIYLSGSVGVALYPSHGRDMTNVLRNVDMAVHHAKRQGGNTFKFFSEELGAEALERAALERGLRQALTLDEFHLCYQPKMDLMTGRVAGAEALLRWTSAELGVVPPMRFIPVAEETGLILPIGAWVIRTACEQIKAWQNAGLEPLPISVNLSARQFHQPDLVETVGTIVADSGIDPELLELELTESMLIENAEAAIMVMRALKALGVSLSIDDFGTGYSSLAYLKRFPVDTLKIDRSFVKDLPGDKDDAAIACAIISLARTLQLKIVAEGIEEEPQATFLRENGCHQGQGYLFSRPVPAADFVAWRQR